jgi:hypothetical protein
MLARGLKTMDELDAAEDKEREDKEKDEQRRNKTDADALNAFFADPFSIPEFEVEMGNAGEMPQASQGN